RNSQPTKRWPGGYCAIRAQGLALRRRGRPCRYKLARQPELRRMVMDQLAMGRSPEQIAGRLALEHGKTLISHESIYRYIYWRQTSFKEPLYRLLPCRKRTRHRPKRHLQKPAIPRRVSIAKRPQAANQRRQK